MSDKCLARRTLPVRCKLLAGTQEQAKRSQRSHGILNTGGSATGGVFAVIRRGDNVSGALSIPVTALALLSLDNVND
ncbi:hypothetical protein KCP69_23320 [Salmonella enterica subsp. enterica]|nr:hypothetical protein KCP69_23320 [Salmonella enterica subsp. enterica]